MRTALAALVTTVALLTVSVAPADAGRPAPQRDSSWGCGGQC